MKLNDNNYLVHAVTKIDDKKDLAIGSRVLNCICLSEDVKVCRKVIHNI